MTIKQISESYIGQKEKRGNMGFIDEAFEKKMRGVGFYDGAPWCGFFAMLVWKEAGQDISLLSASSRRIIEKATKARNWHSEPKEGAVVVWATFRSGKRQTTGHIGVVTNIDGMTYTTVEGNTTERGGRDGVIVAQRHRVLSKEAWKTTNGLRLMGFCYPEQ
jgi:hypothetical protein